MDIQELGDIPVTPTLQHECITTRFLIHDFPTYILCEEIAQDLQEVDIHVWEVRRFSINVNGTEQ